jgi:hypothetical protein
MCDKTCKEFRSGVRGCFCTVSHEGPCGDACVEKKPIKPVIKICVNEESSTHSARSPNSSGTIGCNRHKNLTIEVNGCLVYHSTSDSLEYLAEFLAEKLEATVVITKVSTDVILP